MQFSSSKAICAVCFLGTFERAEVMPISMQLYSRNPAFSSAVKTDTFISRSIIFLSAAISMVLRRRCFSQVFPAIVALNFVAMINFVLRPFSSHPYPNNSMGEVIFSRDTNFNSSLVVNSPCNATYRRAFGQTFFPSQYARIFIVIKNLADKFRRKIVMRIFMSTHVGSFRLQSSFCQAGSA